MRDLTLSLLQTHLHWQDAAANRAHFEGLIAEIGGSNAAPDLIVLPEMFTTGFTMDAAAHAETMDGDSVAWMEIVARDYGVTLCGSLIIEDGGRYYNRLVWMPPNGNPGWYDKRHLFRMASEQEHYSAGRERRIFMLNDWRVCPLVCYDLRFPAWCRGVNEFDLQIFVANWPATRRSAWCALLPARAIENQCYAVGVNRIGTDGNDRRYSGDSGVYDYLGAALADCGDKAQTTTLTLSGAALERY
ncbi:MAG: amidohydrolase, partial [Gammaproteobacteria bacterium]